MKNPKVDMFFGRAISWLDIMEKMREYALDSGLVEELKWGKPCYTHEKKNIVIIQPFKEYCALMFFKGSLLEDPDNILIQLTENMIGQRQIRCTDVQEVINLEGTIKTYIKEAIEIEKAGLKVQHKKASDYEIVEEFQTKLDEMPELKEAFEALTPGRQKMYLYHFSQAKQSKTRLSRVEKYIPKILEGKGMND